MRKAIAFVLAVLLVMGMVPTAFAENTASNTTTLTTSVPDAVYTLHIPADTTIPFGNELTSIGNVTVTNASGFADGKNLAVTVTYAPFSSNGVSTTIPYILKIDSDYDAAAKGYHHLKNSGDVFTFVGLNDGSVEETASQTYKDHKVNYTEIAVAVDSDAWGKALAGTYTSVISFTAEVVVE